MNERPIGPGVRRVAKRAARILENGHTTKAWARRIHGEECSSADPEAISFCYVGALYRAVSTCGYAKEGAVYSTLYRVFTRAVQRETGLPTLMDANDNHPSSPALGIALLRKIAQGEEP